MLKRKTKAKAAEAEQPADFPIIDGEPVKPETVVEAAPAPTPEPEPTILPEPAKRPTPESHPHLFDIFANPL